MGLVLGLDQLEDVNLFSHMFCAISLAGTVYYGLGYLEITGEVHPGLSVPNTRSRQINREYTAILTQRTVICVPVVDDIRGIVFVFEWSNQ
jgi:hypothetical protein